MAERVIERIRRELEEDRQALAAAESAKLIPDAAIESIAARIGRRERQLEQLGLDAERKKVKASSADFALSLSEDFDIDKDELVHLLRGRDYSPELDQRLAQLKGNDSIPVNIKRKLVLAALSTLPRKK